MKDFVFVDEWRIAAEPAQVWAWVRRVEGWPDWWPSVRRVDRLDGPGEAGPETWRFTFQTRLPYAIIFETAIVAEDTHWRWRSRWPGGSRAGEATGFE